MAEAEERAAHPVVDEATLTASLGQHSAQILRHAHEEAARIVVQAQEGAATLLRETQSQVDELQACTEASSAERVVEVELLVANAEQEARVESERILAEAVADGEAVIARAKDEGRALLEQVQEARRRVLSDLASRRRALGIQIEQLRAARDEMAASVLGVRDKVDGIVTHLERTDEEARAAAAAVGDQFRLHGAGEGPHDQDTVEDTTGETPATPAGGGATGGGPGEDDAGGRRPPLRSTSSSPASAPGTGATGGSAAPPSAAPASTSAAEPAEAGTAQTEVVEAAPAEAVPGPDDELISRRDEALAPVIARLGRSIKRALGDDQNRLLDRLRNAPSLTVEELLGPEDEHSAAFVVAARSQLAEAFAAGTAFGGAAAAAVVEGDAVEQSAEGLAHVVVTMLRRQMADRGDELSDRVGAAFREWRGERVERLTGDYATQAFSAGVMAAAGDDKVRWVVTSTSGCSDCEDNALAGAVSASQAFPTGHAHPPAHSGCRCLVAPAGD